MTAHAQKTFFNFFVIFLLLLHAGPLASAQDYLIENFNVSNGLPNNCIQQIMCSRDGLIWFATEEGLCRYDGHEFKPIEFKGIDNRECEIWAVQEDSNGFLWLIVGDILYKADREKRTAEKISFLDEVSGKEKSLFKRKRIQTTPDGKIWVTFTDDSMVYINPSDNSITPVPVKPVSWTCDNSGAIYYLSDNHKVFITRDNFETSEYLLSVEPFGNIEFIFYIDGYLFLSAPDIIIALNLSTRNYFRFNWKNLNSIKQLKNGDIWASTNNGVYLLDKDFNELQHFSTANSGPTNLIDNIIRMVCEDKNGSIWVASMYEGVSHIMRNKMGLKQIRETDSGSVLERITSIDEDSNHNLWLGTETAGLARYSISEKSLSSVKLPLGTPNIAAVFMDGEDLLVSPYSAADRLIKLNTPSGHISPLGEVSGVAYSFIRDADSVLWAGTNVNAARFDTLEQEFKDVPEISKGVFGITEDKDGSLWLWGHNDGLINYSKDGIKKYSVENNSLPTNTIRDIFRDRNDIIWATSNGHGLIRYDNVADCFVQFHTSCDEEDKNLYKIIEDGNGMLWATSSKGLLYINPSNGNAFLYSFTNLFPYDNFSLTAFFIASDGKAYAGTNCGLLSFDPENLTKDILSPSITVSSFSQLGNINASHSFCSTEKIEKESKVILPYRANSFEIRVTDTDYSYPKPYILEYRVNRISSQWAPINDGLLSFSSLSPGKYLLELRARGIDGPYKNSARTVQIVIRPPFILSLWGLTLVALLIISSAIILARIVANKEHRKAEADAKIAMELQKAENEKKEYSSKIEFLSSVAHDIRTPLSLVQLPIEELTKKMVHNSDKSIREDLEILNRNSEILRVLINELLDFQKLEKKMHTPKMAEYDVVSLVKTAIDRFALSAGKKDLTISSLLPDTPLYALTDSMMVDKILGNLLSNALKFSQSFVNIRMDSYDGQIRIVIENDGEVIPLSARKLIFEPFVRYENGQMRTTGTGLGLSICRSFSTLLGGSLEMDDDTRINRFILVLPASEVGEKDTSKDDCRPSNIKEASKFTASVLLVEDNADMLNLISRMLNKQFNVICAANGEEAMDIIEKGPLPSIVISDVMMPRMDGFTLCKAIKKGEKSRHIPVILLTARIGEESRLQGLEYGADAYFEKPVSAALLLSTVQSLLNNRQIIRDFYSSHPTVDTVELDANSPDNRFLISIQDYVMENLANSNLRVEDIASYLCVSPSSLFKKMKAITGVTPSEYLLNMRLKAAKNLLADYSIPISEISDATGFNSHSYFSSLFKKNTGMTPLQYRESLKK